MLFWLLVLAMLVAAILCVLWPLSRSYDHKAAPDHTLDVYRKQLSELEARDASTPEEAETIAHEKAEVSRRILRENSRLEAAGNGDGASRAGKILSIALVLVVLPAISLVFYGIAGSPNLPDSPLAAVRSGSLEGRSVEQMVQIAEQHLNKNPEDIKGWKLLAKVYGRLNRPSDRARALEQIIRISGPTPVLLADLGEALTVTDGNIVSQRARKLFEQAWEEDKSVLKASVYLALALEQEGRFLDATARWNQLALKNQDNPNWQSMVAERLAIIQKKSKGEPLGGPDQSDIDNASTMNARDRAEMIKSMVAGLAEKLKNDPENIEGWLRLIQSYKVLGQSDLAIVSLNNARQQFRTQPDNLLKINELAQKLDLPMGKEVGKSN